MAKQCLMMITKSVVKTDPHTIGMPKSISKAIAPPKISAKEVEIDANTAVAKTGLETHLGQN